MILCDHFWHVSYPIRAQKWLNFGPIPAQAKLKIQIFVVLLKKNPLSRKADMLTVGCCKTSNGIEHFDKSQLDS